MKRSWWFSLVLLAVYVAAFSAWMFVDRFWVAASGLASVAGLCALFQSAYRSRYFANRWDAFWHATVILDILLEATLIPAHQHKGFLLCAASFVVVVGGYRLWSQKRAPKPVSQPGVA